MYKIQYINTETYINLSHDSAQFTFCLICQSNFSAVSERFKEHVLFDNLIVTFEMSANQWSQLEYFSDSCM